MLYLGFPGERTCATICIILAYLAHELPLTRVQRITEWSLGYQLVHLISSVMCFVGAISIHVPCMQPFFENPNPNGL